MIKELALTFNVPETDFDGITVTIAIAELERQLKDYRNRDNTGLRAALDILKVVHQRYFEAVNETAKQNSALVGWMPWTKSLSRL